MWNATLCLIHCLMMPFLFSILGMSRVWVENVFWDALFASVGFFAVYQVHREHGLKSRWVRWMWLLVGLLFMSMLTSRWLPTFEYIAYLASAMLAWVHLRHYRQCRLSSTPKQSLAKKAQLPSQKVII